MKPEQKETLSRFYAAATEQDAMTLRSLLTDDFKFTGPIGTFDNPDDYVDHLVGFGGWVSDSRFIAEGDRVAHLCIYHMTSPGTATIPLCDIFTFDGNRLQAQELFTDTRLFPSAEG